MSSKSTTKTKSSEPTQSQRRAVQDVYRAEMAREHRVANRFRIMTFVAAVLIIAGVSMFVSRLPRSKIVWTVPYKIEQCVSKEKAMVMGQDLDAANAKLQQLSDFETGLNEWCSGAGVGGPTPDTGGGGGSNLDFLWFLLLLLIPLGLIIWFLRRNRNRVGPEEAEVVDGEVEKVGNFLTNTFWQLIGFFTPKPERMQKMRNTLKIFKNKEVNNAMDKFTAVSTDPKLDTAGGEASRRVSSIATELEKKLAGLNDVETATKTIDNAREKVDSIRKRSLNSLEHLGNDAYDTFKEVEGVLGKNTKEVGAIYNKFEAPLQKFLQGEFSKKPFSGNSKLIIDFKQDIKMVIHEGADAVKKVLRSRISIISEEDAEKLAKKLITAWEEIAGKTIKTVI